MLIISNVKDYYDYCISYYGLDKDVVYDRREYSDVKNSEFFKQTEYYGFDSYRTNVNIWVKNENGKYKREKRLSGKFSYFILEVGNTHYIFSVERYKDNNNEIHVNSELKEVKENIDKIVKDVPLAIIPCHYYYNWLEGDYVLSSIYKQHIIKNPILKDTYITSYISGEDMFLKIYNWLLSEKDKPIIDKRTDIQKLEGYGFDKLSSFRNPIISANSKKKKK
jgi:hypothetical protein